MLARALNQRVLNLTARADPAPPTDGNFSFSLAYARRFPAHRVTATSFDSKSELLAKYREFRGILPKLEAACARVAFEVDATDIGGTLPPDQAGAPQPLFDCIIFNFPHLGVEDIYAHRFLLCHYFASARQSIKPSSPARCAPEAEPRAPSIPEVRVALTLDQADNWDVAACAVRAGLQLYKPRTVAFNPAEWPGYECKRHQVNRSFPLSRTRTFTLRRPCDCTEEQSASTEAPTQFQAPHNVPEKTDYKCAACGKVFKTPRARSNHVLVKHQASPEDFLRVLTPNDLSCWKSRVHGVSVKPKEYASRDAFAAAMRQRQVNKAKLIGEFRSRLGERMRGWTDKRIVKCLDSAVLVQRQGAKRIAAEEFKAPTGSTALVASEMTRKRPRPEPPATEHELGEDKKVKRNPECTSELHCSVCNVNFSTRGAWEAHLRGLKPRKTEAKFKCAVCGLAFREARALAQHNLHKHTVVARKSGSTSDAT